MLFIDFDCSPVYESRFDVLSLFLKIAVLDDLEALRFFPFVVLDRKSFWEFSTT